VAQPFVAKQPGSTTSSAFVSAPGMPLMVYINYDEGAGVLFSGLSDIPITANTEFSFTFTPTDTHTSDNIQILVTAQTPGSGSTWAEWQSPDYSKKHGSGYSYTLANKLGANANLTCLQIYAISINRPLQSGAA
jgi:hypothetical protein